MKILILTRLLWLLSWLQRKIRAELGDASMARTGFRVTRSVSAAEWRVARRGGRASASRCHRPHYLVRYGLNKWGQR